MDEKSRFQELFEQAEALAEEFVCAHNYLDGNGWECSDAASIAVVMGKRFSNGLYHVYFWEGEYAIAPEFDSDTPEVALEAALFGMQALIEEEKKRLCEALAEEPQKCAGCGETIEPGQERLIRTEDGAMRQYHNKACYTKSIREG